MLFFSLFIAKIGIFYTVFYGVLAALVAVCMWVFLQTLDPRIPKWKLHESLIGTNPGTCYLHHHHVIKLYIYVIKLIVGLGFRPLPPEDNVESTLIWYRGTNKENYGVWTNALDEFLHRK